MIEQIPDCAHIMAGMRSKALSFPELSPIIEHGSFTPASKVSGKRKKLKSFKAK